MISTERSELLDALPHVREQPALREDAAGFSYVAAPDNAFVAPSLRQAKPSAAVPSLILVEARAAVGKSMLARHLAWASGGPLWDLSETYVGTGTLWGSLAKAFGPEQLNNIIGRTVTGEFVLIIDALDEAEMHAGGEAFDAFLIELRDMFASPRPMPGAVILGRTETIGYVEIFLSGTVPLSRYHIVDFDRQLAYRFIDNRLDSGKISDPSFTAGAHRKREKLYKEARERLLDFLADRLIPDRHGTHAGREEEVTEDWPARIRSFLGYAPVLETVAEYLASYAANYPALIAELGNMEVDPYHSGNAQWNMLQAIVRRLLEREQGKVITQLRKVISDSEVARWASLYSPEEQCARVLGRVTRSAELQDLAADVPVEVEARYREVLGNAIPNHPFFGRFFGYANVVFRDYIHAWGLCSTNSTVNAAVRSELHSNDYLPSPLLGPFILTGSVGDNLPTIDGQDVGFVYESLLTHGDSDLYLFTGPNEPANAFIGNDPAADVAVFQVRSPDQGVKFWRRVSNAQVRGEMVVELGLPGRSFSLGPNVNIDTFIIEVPCRAIRVYTAPDQGVHLAASGGYVGGDVEAELYRFGAGELTVSWDDIRYPWVGYAEPPDVGRVAESLFTDPALRDAFFPLCRIAQKFATSHRSNRPFWGPVHLESSFIKQRRSGNQLDVIMSWLIDQSVIFILSRNYFLDSRRLYEEFRVWLFDLCARKETLEAFRLLERIVYGADPG